ncbi:hypothetical protein NESM_000273200 [Novymonas esmeraldas]|uniref:Uncharacterized protein n=1 Tax=Novymonas esmeraldas TaxID=1808958 RepID=A0AAW0FB23_9TRYP
MLDAHGRPTKAHGYLVGLVLDMARFRASRYGAAPGGVAHTAATTIPETTMRGTTAIERQTAIPFRIEYAQPPTSNKSRQRWRNKSGRKGPNSGANNGAQRLLEGQGGPLHQGPQRDRRRTATSHQSSRSSSAGSYRAYSGNGPRAGRGGA